MDLIAEIDARIERRSLLTHPFYERWTAGTLPLEAVRDYAGQYHAFESTLPRYLSALHTRTDEGWARQALLDNLWDEEHGEENHAELWLRFAEGIGARREDVLGADPNAATSSLLDSYRRSSTRAPVAAGVAALYSYERQVPSVARAKIHGLARHYGIDGGPATEFFRVHATVDEGHSHAEARIISELGPGHADEVVAAAQEALDAWWGFLAAVTPPPSADTGAETSATPGPARP